MGCLLFLAAMVAPRVVMVFIWLLTPWFRVFNTYLWPVLGFVFMPYTTLAYMGAILNTGGLRGVWVVLLVLAVLVDISHWGGGTTVRRRGRRRR